MTPTLDSEMCRPALRSWRRHVSSRSGSLGRLAFCCTFTHPLAQGMHTVLRNAETPMEDFIFFADRLATLIVEYGLNFLPYRLCLENHKGRAPYSGKELDVKVTLYRRVFIFSSITKVGDALRWQNLCGVSILRSGACLERGLRRVVRDVSLGSVLIQNDSRTGEPLLYDVRLPENLRNRDTAKDSYVFLMDSQIGTGATAMMAIRVLLDHGVPQDHIIVICFLISRRGGVHAIGRAFP
jgi:uridine kinase